MPTSFAAQIAALPVGQLNKFGSIGDRLYSQLTIVKNGRSFTDASVTLSGGLGVAIAPHQIWQRTISLKAWMNKGAIATSSGD